MISLRGNFTAAGNLGSVQDLEMVSDHYGWVLASGAVLRTVDDGATWARSALPGRPVLVSGWFFSAARAIVETKARPGVGPGALYETTNGGQTWTRVGRTPTDTTVQQFIDPYDGWTAWTGPGAADSEPFKLIRTTDGGRSWKTVLSVPLGGGGSGDFGWARFATPRDGWMITWITAAPGFSWSRTLTGGQTWEPQTLPVLKSGYTLVTNLQPPGFWGADGVMSGWEDGRLITYHTIDGGNSWTVVQGSGVQAYPPNLFPGTTGVNWSTSKVGWLGPMLSADAKSYLLYRTVNGGRSWRVASRFSGLTWGESASPQFASPTAGWLLVTRQEGAQYELWRTTDGGRHWHRASLSPASGG